MLHATPFIPERLRRAVHAAEFVPQQNRLASERRALLRNLNASRSGNVNNVQREINQTRRANLNESRAKNMNNLLREINNTRRRNQNMQGGKKRKQTRRR